MTALSDLQATQAAATAIQALVAAAVNEIQTLAVSIASGPGTELGGAGIIDAAEKINTLAMNLQTAVATAFPPPPTAASSSITSPYNSALNQNPPAPVASTGPKT